ncbi:zinc-dependent metalloprotease [Caulobacter sp. KR2-114]|uniref:zinc-dependent metalloprotease n=1 Tax=Caulobacter sp. KR2-114 TaxID=3400912 RepID=UPI003C06DEBD
MLRRALATMAMTAALGLATAGAAQVPARPPATADAFGAATAGLERKDGLLSVYLDRKGGRVLLALKPGGGEGTYGRFLYQAYLREGLGSAPVGLDRSDAGAQTQVLAFQRAGKRVFANLENYGFQATHGSPDEVRAVRDSFASSTIWSGDIVAEGADGTLLVDASSFLIRDGFGVADRLKAARQGAFHVDASLSYPDVGETLAFPENLEFEAHQTFVSDEPGDEVTGITPAAHQMTLVEHHSLIKLPEPGYTPRLADPRTGAFASVVDDYSAPLDKPVVIRLAHRFRLEKLDPSAPRSRVKKPIVFYVDRSAPEPIRSALVEGASWWSQAFEAAGYVDAFRVEVLPEGVSPLDARYNVINWVHRQSRGWSYGENIFDPRTGEIIKGAVLLGSLRVRQDRLIFEGLVGADRTGTGAQDDPVRVALMRIRQLGVHESGHALGLEHNFAGSAFGDRESVMDYPPPRVKIDGDRLDFSDAYKVGIGAWDRFAIRWLYDQAPPGEDQQARLDRIVREGYAQGLKFVSDDDARPAHAANPAGALWDDGPDAIAGLAHVMAVRRIALDRFGLRNLPPGAPVADLKRIVVPIYLFHRYEVDAAAKLVGGVDFDYPVAGDSGPVSRPVAGVRQRQAADALMATLEPAALDLPDPLIALLSAGGYSDRDKAWDIEVFGKSETPVFDLSTAVEAAADITFGDLFDVQRLNRVEDLGARDTSQLALGELIRKTTDAAFPARKATGREALIRHRVQARLIVWLARDLQDGALSPAAAADIRAGLDELGRRLKGAAGPAGAQARDFAAILADPARLKALAEADKARHVSPPPGMPIGGEDCWLCATDLPAP